MVRNILESCLGKVVCHASTKSELRSSALTLKKIWRAGVMAQEQVRALAAHSSRGPGWFPATTSVTCPLT